MAADEKNWLPGVEITQRDLERDIWDGIVRLKLQALPPRWNRWSRTVFEVT